MKRLLVIAIVAAAALILALPAAQIVRSSEAKPVAPIELRAPETTRRQTRDAAGEGDKQRQGSVSRPPTSAAGEANPAPAPPPAPAGDDDDDADDGDDGGADD
jgi:hypothetical protein